MENKELAEMNRELQDSVSDATWFIDRCRDAFETRFCIWPGQSPDGRKHRDALGEEAFPWENASDSRIRLADEVINDLTKMLRQGLTRATLQAMPIEATDQRAAGAVSTFVQWITGTLMAEDINTEVKLLAHWCKLYGISVLAVTWDIESRIYKQMIGAMGLIAQEGQMQGGKPEELASAMMDPTREDDVVRWLMKMFPAMKAGNARRQAVSLRDHGHATVPIQRIVKNQPKWTACRAFRDVFWPANSTELRSARWIAYREALSEDELRKRGMVDDYNEEALDKVIRDCRGKSVLEGTRFGATQAIDAAGIVDDMKDLYEVICYYERVADDDGHVTIKATVFNPGYSEEPLTTYEVGYYHNEYHFVEFIRERTERILLENRGVAEIVSTHQKEVKTQRDYRVDRSALAIAPPVRVPAGRVTTTLNFGPNVKVPERVKGEHEYMLPPAPDTDTVAIELQTMSGVNSYFARPTKDSDPTRISLYAQDAIEDWLAGFRKVMRQTLSLCRQYISDEVFLRVTNVPMKFNTPAEDQIAEWDMRLDFNANDLNLDMVIKKLDVINKAVLPTDTMGVVDRNFIISWAMRAIDSTLGEMAVKDIGSATNAEIEDETVQFTKIVAGVEPEMKEGQNYGLRLQVLNNIVQKNPNTLQKLDETSAAMLKRRMQHFQFQLQQQQNAQIGRMGAAPAVGSPSPLPPARPANAAPAGGRRY